MNIKIKKTDKTDLNGNPLYVRSDGGYIVKTKEGTFLSFWGLNYAPTELPYFYELEEVEDSKEELKTLKGWRESKADLYFYLNEGNKVDEELIEYTLDTLPPATNTSRCVQMGEPYDHCPTTGKGRYATFHKRGEDWFFSGNMTIKEARSI